MSRDSIDQLVDRWMEDDTFRAAVRKDPEAAVRGTGLDLSEEEWQAIRSIDWSMSDEELTTRASKTDPWAWVSRPC